jgi:hypothetical protein
MGVLELQAERLVAGGDALARDGDGRIVFVTGAVTLTIPRANFGPHIGPFGPLHLFSLTALIGVPVALMAARKGNWALHGRIMAGLFIGGIGIAGLGAFTPGRPRDVAVERGPELSPWGFRTTVRLAVEGGRLGFRAAQCRDVVPVDHCLVAHPLLADVIAETRAPDAEEVTVAPASPAGSVWSARPTTAEATTVGASPAWRWAGRGDHRDGGRGALARLGAILLPVAADGAEALVAAVRRRRATGVGHRRRLCRRGPLRRRPRHDAEVECIENRPRRAVTPATTWPSARPRSCRAAPSGGDRARPSSSWPIHRAVSARKAVEVLASTGASRFILVSCDAVALARDARLLTARLPTSVGPR